MQPPPSVVVATSSSSTLLMPASATSPPKVVPSFSSQLTTPNMGVSVQFKTSSSSNLGAKLVGDVLVAAGVTFGVSPFITVVDKAIVQRAAGSHTLLSSAADSLKTMARNPVAYVKSPFFLLMWAVYGATYATANSLKTIVEHQEQHYKKDESRPNEQQHLAQQPLPCFGKMGVFIGTTLVNSGTSLLKDKTYAKMFGTSTGAAASSMPLITYGLWATRDLMVVGSSFVLPELVTSHVQEQFGWNKADAFQFSQLTVPIATQFLAGPIQLLGLDFYNRPLAHMSHVQAAMERVSFLANGYWSVVAARVARIAPAYSIGGVYNTKFRDLWRNHLLEKEEEMLFLERSAHVDNNANNNSSCQKQQKHSWWASSERGVTAHCPVREATIFEIHRIIE